MTAEVSPQSVQYDWNLEVSVEGNVAIVTIHRQSKKNSLTPELCDELTNIVQGLDADETVRVIALRGAGADFSAGADITRLTEVLFDRGGARRSDGGAGLDHLSRLDEALGACTKPTVALVQGICMGGGWQLALACDIVLCSDDARIAITPALLGLVYPQRGVERLVRLVGESRAKHLLFTGDRVTPADAERWGLVTVLYTAETFAHESNAYLHRLAERSQYAIQHTKRLIDIGVRQPQYSDDAWSSVWAEVETNPDLAEGRAAFAEGRRPQFVWPAASGMKQ